ncbi:hypothetical protein INR49_029656 [Caranx melampygus]|nr:hypothetical protein INR49_029656 [Caranx melampygus]
MYRVDATELDASAWDGQSEELPPHTARELHRTADDHDGDELPADRAVSEQLPGSAGPQAFDFSLFLQDLIELVALDLTATETSAHLHQIRSTQHKLEHAPAARVRSTVKRTFMDPAGFLVLWM